MQQACSASDEAEVWNHYCSQSPECFWASEFEYERVMDLHTLHVGSVMTGA